jgi:phage terminase large subunit GpA-like protein
MKTELMLNTIGYYIHQDPAPIMVMQPTEKMAEAFSKDRLDTMLRDSPALAEKAGGKKRDSGNTILHKQFPGGHVTMVGANAPGNLAMRPIRVLLEDEINGSIMIIKEGQADRDLSFMFFNQEGKIQIEGTRIFLGKATEQNEPYIKWSIYKKHIDELKTQINALADQIKIMAALYEGAFKTSFAIPFAPIASLNALNATPAGSMQTQAKIEAVKSKIETINAEDAKSSKIFGE